MFGLTISLLSTAVSLLRTVVNGDIHTHLAEIYGTDRKTGKGVTYCLIYGGGNAKLGSVAGGGSPRRVQPSVKKIMSGSQGLQAAIR